MKLPRRIIPRFRLRTLLLATAAVAVVLGWETNRATRQARAVRQIQASGGHGYYEDRWLPGKDLLAPIIGHDYFRRVYCVEFNGPNGGGYYQAYPRNDNDSPEFGPTGETGQALTAETIAALESLEVERLTLSGFHMPRELAGQLSRMKSLTELSVTSDPFDTPELNGATPETQTALEQRLAPLSQLPQLRRLGFRDGWLNDDNVGAFARLPQIVTLGVGQHNVSVDGVERLMKAAPNLKEVAGYTPRANDAAEKESEARLQAILQQVEQYRATRQMQWDPYFDKCFVGDESSQ